MNDLDKQYLKNLLKKNNLELRKWGRSYVLIDKDKEIIIESNLLKNVEKYVIRKIIMELSLKGD